MKAIQLIPILILGLASTLAQGQPPAPVVEEIDRNGNREISKREIRKASESLRRLDEDGDGALSAEELRPEPPTRERDHEGNRNNPPPPPSVMLTALDTDGDGELSKEEIKAAPESLATLDRDEDGKLEVSEAGIELQESEGMGPGGPGGPPPHGPRRPRR